MSAHVLLNLLNELGKSDKMRGLPSILSLFCNEFNKFNKTRPRMLDSIYHYTPANFVCGGYTVFTLSVRASVCACVRPSVTFCFLNILKSHC